MQRLTPTSTEGDVANSPIVSVIITYYNQERFIRDTVLSVTRQSYPRLEIIVVDDGSTKPVTPILADIAGIKILRTENRGCPAARNFGFRHSTGEYLVFLDGDDLLLPDAVTNQVRALRSRPDAALVFGAAQYINEHGEAIGSPRLCRARNDYFLMLLECNPVPIGAAMVARESFVKAGLFDESFFVVEDYDLLLRLLRGASAIRNPERVFLYRRHSGNLSNNLPRMLSFVQRALDKVESRGDLTRVERRRLEHGRKRWAHAYAPKITLGYKVMGLYFRCRAMFTVPVGSYFHK